MFFRFPIADTVKTGGRYSLSVLMLVCGGVSLATAQVTEPIPPPHTPNTLITNLNSMTGYVRAKASPDECFAGVGLNQPYAFLNLANPSQPCPVGQQVKVDQSYVWGTTLVGTQIYFGTLANSLCVVDAANPNATPTINNFWVCEYGNSAYSPNPYPAVLGDLRPPRAYVYNILTHTIKDITPKLGGVPPSSICGAYPTGNNPLCVDPLWLKTEGIRSATPYTDPSTGRTYVLFSGPALVQNLNALNLFAYDIAAQQWVAKYQLVGYNDQRHWLNYQGVVYAPVQKAFGAGGALLRYTGSFANIPPIVPSASNGYSQIPGCGSTSTSNPPGDTYACFAFQDVGDFDGDATEVEIAPAGSLDAGRIFTATWPPTGTTTLTAGSIFMSPVVPAGGLTPANAGQWTKVWSSANYDPDPVINQTYGTGAIKYYMPNPANPSDSYLYWGTMNLPLAAFRAFVVTYGEPPNQQVEQTDVLDSFRPAVVFRGKGFSTGTPTIQLLYGQKQLDVYNPTTATWVPTNNNVPNPTCPKGTGCGTAPLYGTISPTDPYGTAGFNNPFTQYIWSMGIWNNKLYVGTMNWLFLGSQSSSLGTLVPPSLLQGYPYGGQLYYFGNNTSAAVPVSYTGVGNYLNYGVRNIIPFNSNQLFVGTANPMNLSTGSNTAPYYGGWELIELNTGTGVVSR